MVLLYTKWALHALHLEVHHIPDFEGISMCGKFRNGRKQPQGNSLGYSKMNGLELLFGIFSSKDVVEHCVTGYYLQLQFDVWIPPWFVVFTTTSNNEKTSVSLFSHLRVGNSVIKGPKSRRIHKNLTESLQSYIEAMLEPHEQQYGGVGKS